MKPLDLTKPMQTRDGTRKVVSWLKDDSNGWIYVKFDNGAVVTNDADGRRYEACEDPDDLVNTPEQYTVTVYVLRSTAHNAFHKSGTPWVTCDDPGPMDPHCGSWELIGTFTHTGTVGEHDKG